MAAAAAAERGRSWYLSKEEIERGSPSRRDGVGAAREDQLRATYCSFIRDVGLRLKLPQITIATGIVLCHRFYLHQSHAKNEWQTVATVCIFLASKMEDTPCPLERVVVAAHETMYKKNPVAARRIKQKELLEKRKALILAGESLLLSTIRYDFNIQHPYEPLKVALKNLGITQKEVKQAAINLINDTLRTTLVVQFKPHYIAAGSLSLAARFHNVRLPTEKEKVWWHQFDVAPKQLEAATKQMKELFMKRNPLPTSPAIQPTPAQTPAEKQQIISTTPAIRPIPAQTPVEKQPTISTTPAIRPIAQAPVEKQPTISMTPATRPIPAQTPVEKKPTISSTPAIRPIPALTLVEKQPIISTCPAIRPIPAQTLVEKQPTISTTPAIQPIPAQAQVEKQQIISTSPAIQPIPAQTPVEKQQIISFPKPVLKYTYSRRGLKRPAPAPTLVEKQQIISTVGCVLGQDHSAREGLNRPTTAATPALVKKQKIKSTPDSILRHTHSSVGGTMPTRAPARARTPVRKQQVISTQDSVLRHTQPSVRGERSPATAPVPARARTPVRKQQIISTQVPVLRRTQPSVGGERRSTTAPARSPLRKEQTVNTQGLVLRNTHPIVGGERRSTTAPAPARSPVRKQQIVSTQDSVLRHARPSAGGERRSATAPAGSPVRKEQKISTPDSVLRHTNPSRRGPTSNNLDRYASSCMRVDSSVLQSSTGSLARSEDSKPLRMHVDHSLNKTAKDGRPEELTLRAALRADHSKPLRMRVDHSLNRTAMDGRSEELTLRAALRADHVYQVCSRPKDVNMTRAANFVSKKRKIQEAGEHPALVNKHDGDSWTRPQIRSVIVAPPSLKKQKI